jgi:ubiquinone/menaquinone biosynthesis C-methylase UbiE
MSTPDPLEKLKNGMRNAWMAGDFGRIARFNERVAADFVDRLQLRPGVKVLDVACGSGNLAIPAARAGAEVTGVDIAPNLLEQARRRAEAEKLIAKFDEGDAEKLPYADASFDVVMSMFGAMFAPRPELVAAELARVCRPGGTIAMANWTPSGSTGRGFATASKYLPPPEGVPAPVLWGDASIVRQRLAAHRIEVQTRLQKIIIDFPFPPKQLVGFYREYFGPAKTAFSRLDSETRSHYAADLEAFWTKSNLSTEGRTVIQSEYLEVVGRKR